MHIRIALAASLVAAAAAAQAPARPTIVTTSWLAQHLNDPKVVVLHVTHDTTDFRMGHIVGAREISYDTIGITRDSIRVELPPAEQLRDYVERLGVSDDSHVIVYTGMNGMGPMASRVFLSLDFLGHPNVSLLSGGLSRWRAESRPTSSGPASQVPRGHITTRTRDVVVNADYVMAHTGKKGFAFIDTRTTPEYLGTGERSGLRSDGHVAGARQLEWEQLFANADSTLFLDPSAIAKLFAERSAPGDTLITYCLVGYRASMTYFGARLSGLPVKIYDGSYQDWARRKLPVKKGEAP